MGGGVLGSTEVVESRLDDTVSNVFSPDGPATAHTPVVGGSDDNGDTIDSGGGLGLRSRDKGLVGEEEGDCTSTLELSCRQMRITGGRSRGPKPGRPVGSKSVVGVPDTRHGSKISCSNQAQTQIRTRVEGIDSHIVATRCINIEAPLAQRRDHLKSVGS